jgi:hypothetical protein
LEAFPFENLELDSGFRRRDEYKKGICPFRHSGGSRNPGGSEDEIDLWIIMVSLVIPHIASIFVDEIL